MTSIHLVRHGVAAGAAPGMSDLERPLTPEGVEKTIAMARGFAALHAFDGVVISSPLRRAVETAEILADEFMDDGEIMICDALTPEGSAQELTAFLEHAAPGREILAVGHLPSIVEILADLIGASRGFRVQFKKAAIATVEFSGSIRLGAGELTGFLQPWVLRGLGDL